MNFEKAEDRAAHHLIQMDRRLDSMNAVIEARHLLWELLHRRFKITADKYAEVSAWIDAQERGMAQWKAKNPRHRYPVDERIEPQNLTAEQRRRLAAQRKEPGMGGQ